MPNHKYLTLDERVFIHSGLNLRNSFAKIAVHLDKGLSTISKEVRNHRIKVTSGSFGRIPNKCINRGNCTVRYLCDKPNCHREFCRSCKNCNDLCSQFQEELCQLLSKPPYVCNGCKEINTWILTKQFFPCYNCR